MGSIYDDYTVMGTMNGWDGDWACEMTGLHNIFTDGATSLQIEKKK